MADHIEIIISLICFLLLCGFIIPKSYVRKWRISGLIPSMLFHFHRIFDKYTEELQWNNGTIVLSSSRFYASDILMTSDPANVLYVLRTKFSNFPKGKNSKRIFDVFGDMLFNADLDEWRNHRKVAHALFSDPRFLQTNFKINRHVIQKGLVPVFEYLSEKGIVVDLQDLFQRLTFDLASLMVTGYYSAALRVGFPEDAFANALYDAPYVFLLRHFSPEGLWKVQKWLGIGPEKSWCKAKQVLDQIAENIIKMKQEELGKESVESNYDEGLDALKFFLTNDEVIRSRSALPRSAMRDTLVGLMFAARDTSSAVLSWFFWLLSKNPLVESKLIEELREQISSDVAPNSSEFFDIEKLNKLVYLHGALCETLRLFPPVPLQRRVSIKPDVLPSGHQVNTNTDIILCSYAMGRMESIWGEDCLEFKPERWISEDGKVRIETSSKFLAFSSGPRICPGKELALTRMKVVVATIVYNYHVQVVAGQEVSPASSSILHIKHGLKVRITKRRNY